MGISDYIYLRSALALESATQQKRKKKKRKTIKRSVQIWPQEMISTNKNRQNSNSCPLIRVSAETLYIQGFIFISNMFCVIPRDTNKEQKNFLEKTKNKKLIHQRSRVQCELSTRLTHKKKGPGKNKNYIRLD